MWLGSLRLVPCVKLTCLGASQWTSWSKKVLVFEFRRREKVFINLIYIYRRLRVRGNVTTKESAFMTTVTNNIPAVAYPLTLEHTAKRCKVRII